MPGPETGINAQDIIDGGEEDMQHIIDEHENDM